MSSNNGYTSIENSELSRRAKNCLYKAGFSPETALATVSDASEDELRSVGGLGEKTINEIKGILAKHDYSLRRTYFQD